MESNVDLFAREMPKLSREIFYVIQADELINELYLKLNDIYSLAIPKVIQTGPYEFVSKYDDDVASLIQSIHREINNRANQIISFFEL